MSRTPARASAIVLATFLSAMTACGDDGAATGSGGGTSGSAGGDATTATTVASTGAGDGGAGAATTTTVGSGGSGTSCEDGPALGESAECVACQAEKCCINAEGCLGDEACAAVEACTLAGGAIADCADENPDAVWFLSGIIVCRENNCAEECGRPAAECGNIIPTPESCTDAIQAECCDETAACGANDACVAFIYQCVDQNQCASQACFEECVAQYPDAADDFTAMANCWQAVDCL